MTITLPLPRAKNDLKMMASPMKSTKSLNGSIDHIKTLMPDVDFDQFEKEHETDSEIVEISNRNNGSSDSELKWE